MKCPKCDSEIGECQECPFCGYKVKKDSKNVCIKCGKQGDAYFEGMCQKCYNEKYGNKNKNIEAEEDDIDRAKFLFVFKIIMAVIFVLGAVFYLINEMYLIAVILIVFGAIIYIVIQIFETIIDLLQKINNKL